MQGRKRPAALGNSGLVVIYVFACVMLLRDESGRGTKPLYRHCRAVAVASLLHSTESGPLHTFCLTSCCSVAHHPQVRQLLCGSPLLRAAREVQAAAAASLDELSPLLARGRAEGLLPRHVQLDEVRRWLAGGGGGTWRQECCTTG